MQKEKKNENYNNIVQKMVIILIDFSINDIYNRA